MHRNWSSFTDQISKFRAKCMTNICMELLIERPNFFENIFQLLFKCWVFVLIQPQFCTGCEIWNQEQCKIEQVRTKKLQSAYYSKLPLLCSAPHIYQKATGLAYQPYHTIASNSILVPLDPHSSIVSQLILKNWIEKRAKQLAHVRISLGFIEVTWFQLQITFCSIFIRTNAHFCIIRLHRRNRSAEFFELFDRQGCISQFWQFLELTLQVFIFVNIKIVRE